MAAGYNKVAADGKPAIKIEPSGTSPIIVAAACVTTLGRTRLRKQTYVFPGLSGAGSINAGIEPVEITWGITLMANSMTDLQAFEALFLKYKTGGRYTLESELGQTWANVELDEYEPGELLPVVGGGYRVLRTAVVRFRWMQPGG